MVDGVGHPACPRIMAPGYNCEPESTCQCCEYGSICSNGYCQCGTVDPCLGLGCGDPIGGLTGGDAETTCTAYLPQCACPGQYICARPEDMPPFDPSLACPTVECASPGPRVPACTYELGACSTQRCGDGFTPCPVGYACDQPDPTTFGTCREASADVCERMGCVASYRHCSCDFKCFRDGEVPSYDCVNECPEPPLSPLCACDGPECGFIPCGVELPDCPVSGTVCDFNAARCVECPRIMPPGYNCDPESSCQCCQHESICSNGYCQCETVDPCLGLGC